ncbi:unnamed protein product [Caenorhabditis brenneri]
MSEPTSSAAAAAADAAAADAVAAAVADSDNLRRSKRKKFCLDVVAAAHGNNQKKSRRDPHGDEEYDEDDYEDVGELEELSVVTDSADLTMDDDLDESMMRRRPKRAATSVVTNNGYQDHVVFEMQGEHVCQKCPSRYTSRSSLANHVKMHQGERRKFACELCDFSSTTIKSLTHHMNVHKVHGVVSAPVSPADPSAGSNNVANVTAPPDLLNISTESNTSLNGNGGAAPQLTDATLEPFQDATNDVDDEEDEMMMPPILEREDDGPPVLLRERRLIEDSTEESEEEEESESSTSPEPVRKSGRSTKPTQKKAMAQKKSTPYKKASLLKPLRLDTPLSSGSLPTSSASSVTPPEKRSPSPTSTESSRETTPAAAKNVKIKNKHCAKCPFVTSTLSRLKRHFTGHQVKEGYICPIENCHFICRKAGFLSKHFILHVGLTLPWPPKYVKKIGKKIIEVPELNEHLGEKERKTKKKELENRVKEEPDDLLEDEDEEEDEEEEEILRKEEPVEVKEEEPMEQEPMELEPYEPMEPLEPEPMELEPLEHQKTTKKEKKKVYKKKKAELKKEKAVEEKRHQHHEKKDSMGQAQIRSYKKVEVDGVEQKQCNVGNCEFQTASLTQLVVHKVKEHAAQSAFPSHRFLCFTCGFRAKTYAALRTHKLTNHTHTKSRFHRTYYLKEIVGDKFFIKHFLSQPEEVKTEAPVATAAAVPSTPVISIKEEPKEEDEEDSSDIEDEGDASKSVDVTPAVLALIQSNPDKPILFCCNLCPYKAAISSRLQRHYDKHFTKDKYQCRFCSWSSRNQQVLFNHEKLHTSPEEEVVPSGIEVPFQEVSSRSSSKGPDDSNSGDTMNTTTTSSPSVNSGSPSESTESSEDAIHHPVQESIRKWCHAEKQRRPELEDAFTRKMIDGMKGFQCAECPYTSKYRGDMRSHKKRHDIDQMYRCVQCTYTTNRPVSLKDHLKQHANLNKALDPLTLRKVIVNQGIQIGMRRGGASGRVYTCAKCPYSTLTIGCLWRHYRNHRQTARMNICSNCSYSSMDQRKMEEHTIIHLAMGVNEPMPFVKRVDMNGRPVSSLTDLLGGSERKNNKRKMEEEPSTSGTPDRPEFERFSKKKATPLAPKPAKIAKEEPSPVRTEPPATRGAGARRGSKEDSPDSDYSLPGPSHAAPPTRVLSERATRNRTNYSTLTKSSTRGTPSGSSAHLDQMVKREPDESIEVSHHRIRTGVHSNYGRDVYTKCKECPFKSTDEKLLEQHGTFHEGSPRPQQCTDCSFSHYTAAGLLEHLKLHGIDFDSFQKRLFHKMNRKGDVIPPGVKGYYCKNCSYKTPIKRHYEDHLMSHRQQLVNRLSISMKRQPPKPEYKRPKHRHLFVARNAKYCKKCTFKCSSHSAFIEHLDRHGWNQLYKCYICDYSDNNKSVVDFHQLTHHIVRDQTLHGITQASDFRLEQGEILKPETTSKPKPTPEQFVQQSRSLLKCGSCDYFCHLSEELSFHMSVNHMDEPDTQQTISYLHMGLIPPNATVTTVL